MSIGCQALPGTGASGCTQDPSSGLNGPAGVVVSPDGNNVYVIGRLDAAIAWFSRNPSTGALTYESCIANANDPGSSCPGSDQTAVGLDTPYGITVSPDGKNVYVASIGNGGQVAVFDRSTSTGALTQPAGDCISGTGGTGCNVSNADGFNGDAFGVIVSPDGGNVYVAAGGTTADHEGAIVEFSRNQITGDLSQLAVPNDCIGAPSFGAGQSSGCSDNQSSDVDGSEDLAISPDGKYLYANSNHNDSVIELSRNTSTGDLAQVGCVGAQSGCASVTGLPSGSAPLGVAVSPDGANLYVGTSFSGFSVGSAVVAFARNVSTGLVTQLPAPFDCITSLTSGCGQTGATGLFDARRLTVSPDGKNVYVAGQTAQAIAVLSRVLNADLALGVSGAPPNATQGANFTYTYTITNNGPADVADPTFTLAPSSLLSGVSLVPSQGSCAGDTCHLGRIFAGSSATIAVPVTAASTGNATTTAAVQPSSEVSDPNLANNSASSTTTIQSVQPPPGGALGPPVLHKTANAYPVAGKVYVKLPGTNNFIPLSEAKQLPVGTVVDARHGTIELVFAKPGGGTMTGEYWGGEFTFTQAANGHVTITLIGPLGGKYTSRKGPIAIVARGRPGRSLWSNVHGNFTTRGHASSGSARGTEWLTQDYRNGTKITVTRDVVLVTNLKTHKTQHVHAGHSVFIGG